jgi:hypothetical protein
MGVAGGDAHAGVRDMLRAEEVDHILGHISRKLSIDDLVRATCETSTKPGKV